VSSDCDLDVMKEWWVVLRCHVNLFIEINAFLSLRSNCFSFVFSSEYKKEMKSDRKRQAAMCCFSLVPHFVEQSHYLQPRGEMTNQILWTL
jgi:hypothetical protein